MVDKFRDFKKAKKKEKSGPIWRDFRVYFRLFFRTQGVKIVHLNLVLKFY